MENWKKELGNAVDKLQQLGKKAVDRIDEAIPGFEEKLDKAVDTAKDAYAKAQPVISEHVDKAVDAVRSAYDKVSPVIEENVDKAVKSVKDAFESASAKNSGDTETSADGEAPSEEEEKPLSATEQIDQDVESQMKQIREAQNAPNMISDFIARTYGKKD